MFQLFGLVREMMYEESTAPCHSQSEMGNKVSGLCWQLFIERWNIQADEAIGSWDAANNTGGWLSVAPQHWSANTEQPSRLDLCKKLLLCLRWECVGLRTWDQIKLLKIPLDRASEQNQLCLQLTFKTSNLSSQAFSGCLNSNMNTFYFFESQVVFYMSN